MAEQPETAPQGRTPQQDAEELGVQLTARMQPNLRDFMPKRFVQESEARARGWSMYYTGAACRFGHQAARYVSNPRLCSDCLRVKKGLPTVYPQSRAQTFDSTERVAAQVAARLGAPAAAPPQPSAPREPSRKEQNFLAVLAMVGNFDDAAKAADMTRGQVEARASIDPQFKQALSELCERHSIPWTNPLLTSDTAKKFTWTPDIEKQLIARFIDTGLLEQARTDLGINASTYQQHLVDSPEFAAAVDAARPAARETLKERALHAADKGNDRLLKALEDDIGEDFVRMADGSKVRRLGNPDALREEIAQLLRETRQGIESRQRLQAACNERNALAESKPPERDDSDLTEESAT